MGILKPTGERCFQKQRDSYEIIREFAEKYPEKIDILAPGFKIDTILDESETKLYGSCLDDMVLSLLKGNTDPVIMTISLSERGTFNRVIKTFYLLIEEFKYFLLEKYKINLFKGSNNET